MSPRMHSHNAPRPSRETEALRQRQQELFRQLPTKPSQSFTSGVFLWSSNAPGPCDRGVQDKIDQIRIAHQCHIVYDTDLQGFRIICAVQHGCSEQVQKVIKALKVLCSESLSNSIHGLRAYLVYPPPQMLGPYVVRITNLGSSKPPMEAAVTMSGKEMVAQLVSATTAKEASASPSDDQMQALRRMTPQHLALAINSALERLRYHRGRVRIRALLGVFIFNRYQKSVSTSALKADGYEPALDFINLMRSAKTQGGLYRLKPEARLLERVYQCKELFETPENRSINDVNPYHNGVWTFPSNNRDDGAEVQLRVVTSSNEGPGRPLRVEKSEWNASNEKLNSQALELYVTNLLPELAWKLEIATQRCDRTISRELQMFSQVLHILPPTSNTAHIYSGELMFDWSSADARPKRFHQKTSWRYRLRENPNLIFEVSRIDEFHSNDTKPISFLKARKPHRTVWEACIFDNQWDEYLGQNLTLKTGDSAGWDPSVDNFFPLQTDSSGHSNHASRPSDHASGFQAFMQIVQNVAGRLSRAAL